jgi:hypothetical protein
MSDQDRRAFMKSINYLASQGHRCLAIAEIPNAGALSSITKENR